MGAEKEKKEEKKEVSQSDDTLLTEINRGWRKIEDTPWGDVRIYTNTMPYVQNKGEGAFTKIKGKLLEDPDNKTKQELMVIYEERGIWSKEDEKAFYKKQRDLWEFAKKIGALDGKEKEKQEKILEKQQKEYYKIVLKRTELFNASVESLAEVARRMAHIFYSVRKDPGDDEKGYHDCKPVWEKMAGLETEKDFLFIQGYCNRFWSGMEADESFFDEWLDGLMFKPDGDIAESPEPLSSETSNPEQN